MQIQTPKVMGLLPHADHELKRHVGCVYIQLTAETETADPAYAEVSFDYDVETEYCPAEYIDGYLYAPDRIELGKHTIYGWEIIDVDGCEWTPTADEKERISQLINEYFENIDSDILYELFA